MFSLSISATADKTEIINLPASLDESIPSSTQIRFTPKSCIICKVESTSAAFLANLDNLNTRTKDTPSFPDFISSIICVN